MPTLQEILAAKAAAKPALSAPTPAAKPIEERRITTSDMAKAVVTEQRNPQSLAAKIGLSAGAQSHADLLPRIRELADLADESLVEAMKELKGALLHNPDAVALMLDEDVGLMVDALRRMTGQSIAEATKPKAKGASKKVLSLEAMQAAFEEL